MDPSRSGGTRQPSHRSNKSRRSFDQPMPQQQPYGENISSGYPAADMMYNPNPQQQQAMAAAYYAAANYGAPPGQPPIGNYYNPNEVFQQTATAAFNDPMANMAMAYGQSLMGQGKQMVDQKLEKYVPISKLKYYFAVDTTYVRRKLTLVLFPFANTDWSIKYSQDEPVAPRYEINAPDLYIPVMAFVTFILVAGLALGTQDKFSPEQLGVQASSALGWLVLEVVILLLTTYIMNIQTDLGYLDLLAFCSYKYVGMIASVCAGMVFLSLGYYAILLYSSASLCYFLVKTLRIQILPKSMGDHLPQGNKRRMYLLLCIAVIQPLLMFWLTHHLVPQSISKNTLPNQTD